jgi:uncharacterized protein
MESQNLEQKISQIAAESEKIMESSLKAAHDYEHVRRVYALGIKIGKAEKADMAILKPTILMHDLGRIFEDGRTRHAKLSIPLAKKVLKKVSYPKKLWKPILYAIENHSWKSEAMTLEAKILQDADKLDALGAIGIAKVFTYGGVRNRIEYCPKDPFFRQKRDVESCTLDHIYEKILKLKCLMHTQKGRDIAEERERFIIGFLERLEKELNGEL